VQLHIPELIPVTLIGDSKSFLKYKAVCSAILKLKIALNIPQDQLENLSSNVFQNSISDDFIEAPIELNKILIESIINKSI
jgi:hypothetical protein